MWEALVRRVLCSLSSIAGAWTFSPTKHVKQCGYKEWPSIKLVEEHTRVSLSAHIQSIQNRVVVLNVEELPCVFRNSGSSGDHPEDSSMSTFG